MKTKKLNKYFFLFQILLLFTSCNSDTKKVNRSEKEWLDHHDSTSNVMYFEEYNQFYRKQFEKENKFFMNSYWFHMKSSEVVIATRYLFHQKELFLDTTFYKKHICDYFSEGENGGHQFYYFIDIGDKKCKFLLFFNWSEYHYRAGHNSYKKLSGITGECEDLSFEDYLSLLDMFNAKYGVHQTVKNKADYEEENIYKSNDIIIRVKLTNKPNTQFYCIIDYENPKMDEQEKKEQKKIRELIWEGFEKEIEKNAAKKRKNI